MPVALDSVVKQLEDSGIIAPGKLKEFIPPQAAPKDGEELIRELFKKNHLTRFQAQQVASGRAKSLILGGYVLLDKIGAGGMGQVFKAEHRRMKRLVAIKMLPSALTKDPAAVARFQREVEAAAKLRHPNIVAADDADEANGVHFLVMEYVEGSDLSALVKKHGTLPGSKALNYILQAAKGLEFAHKKGVVHRDIKPANLLVDSEGNVKILDMGLARIDSGGDAATQAELTGTGAVMGTVDYMAPEQALSTKGVDARADIYSLGCTLYYLLAGKCTYDGDTLMAKLLAHREAPIPSLADVQEGVPSEVQALFSKMVAKKAEDRYQTMTEVIADLERAISGQSSPGSLAPPATASDTGLSKIFQALPSSPTQNPQPGVTRLMASPAKATGSKLNSKLILYGSIAGGILALVGIPLVLYFALSGGSTDSPPRVANLQSAIRDPQLPALPADFALAFADPSTVEIPSLKLAPGAPLTLEAYLTATEPEDVHRHVLGVDGQFGLRIAQGGTWGAQIYPTKDRKGVPIGTKTPIAVGQRTHVAGVWTDTALLLFLDGKRVGRAALENYPLPDATALFTLGGKFVGRIDEVRVSKSVRYATDFAPAPRHEPDADTLALYHCDEGTGNVLIDSSPNKHHGKINGAKWVQADGSPIGPTAPAPVPTGHYALRFDQRGQKVESPNVGLDISSPFTIEAYVTPGELPAGRPIFAQLAGISEEFHFRVEEDRWLFYTTHQSARSNSPLVPNKRIHLAGVRSEEKRLLFVDGQLAGEFNEPLSKVRRDLAKPLHPLILESPAPNFTLRLDQLRISQTVRYTQNFTPPPQFTSDNQTLVLYRFSEGTGTVLNDSSGKGHHGKISGATWVNVDGSPITSSVPQPTVVYLDDLPETSWKNGHMRLGKHNLEYNGWKFTWRGKEPAHSLTTHPLPGKTAVVTYRLNGQYDNFDAVVGFGDGIQDRAESPLTFRVTGDGRELWKSPPLQRLTDEAVCAVSVRGIGELGLEVSCSGGNFKAHGVWFEPRLTPFASSPSPQPPIPSPASAGRWPFDPPDGAEYVWSPPENLGNTVNTSAVEIVWGLSADERQLYFQRDRTHWVAHRSADGAAFSSLNPLAGLPGGENGSVSASGLVAALVANRGGGKGEIWLATRTAGNLPFSSPQPAPSPVNGDWQSDRPVLSPDGLSLLTLSTRKTGAWAEVWLFTRPALDQPFATGENLGTPPNTPGWDMPYYVSNDRCFVITSTQGGSESGGERIVRYFTRDKPTDPFGPGVELDIPLGDATRTANSGFRLAEGGRTLYFDSSRLSGGQGKFDIWVTRRIKKP